MLLKNDELLRFQSLVETSGDFIAIAALDGRVIYVNPAGRRLVGLDPDLDVTTTTIADYLTEEGVDLARGRAAGGGRPRALGGRVDAARPPRRAADPGRDLQLPDARPGDRGAVRAGHRAARHHRAADRPERARRASPTQRQELLDRLVQAQEDERARIAADVHDDSVQALAAVELRLGLLRRQLAGRAPEPASRRPSHARRRRSRDATGRLRAPALRPGVPGAARPTSPAPSSEAAAYVFEDRHPAGASPATAELDLPEGLRVTAYRIAKEAMVNVRKHADARKVDDPARPARRRRRGRVTDDGRGFGPDDIRDQPGHLGVTGMRDRAAVAGGWVRVDSLPRAAPWSGSGCPTRRPADPAPSTCTARSRPSYAAPGDREA